MKKTIYLLLFFLSFSALTFAQESDYSLIEKTLHYYLDGDLVDDFEVIKKGFHQNAMMKSISLKTKKYRESNALEVFKKAKKRSVSKPNVKSKIVYINITDTAASAKLETESPRAIVTDYMQLLKIDGIWKIVSKIYTVKLKKNTIANKIN
ncbi:nuclear transport factor 2 family protein [Aquimarina aquimarini]|uniref:nuclear transport factor 2 family protein n=1 Tax=Aquimarina aquimarini TaxID=1191734 RepID=UPI000D55C6F3|nr:nuclear transport factor 2 family protein [Aquimarina aquimarini]